MFHIVFSGNEQAAAALIEAFTAAGYPAQIDPSRAGFPLELLTEFVEIVAVGDDDVAPVVEIAAGFGFRLRMHGPVEAPAVA